MKIVDDNFKKKKKKMPTFQKYTKIEKWLDKIQKLLNLKWKSKNVENVGKN